MFGIDIYTNIGYVFQMLKNISLNPIKSEFVGYKADYAKIEGIW